jgi:hypothetical protein
VFTIFRLGDVDTGRKESSMFLNINASIERMDHAPTQSMLPLMAYIEEPLKLGKPIPVRNSSRLRKVTYPNIFSCRDLQNHLPVDHPIEMDEKFGSNVGTLLELYGFRDEYAFFCPVDADPFLPWLHDLFPSSTGEFIEFIAHNKRRCRTAPEFQDDLANLEPQVSLMQSVSVKRLESSPHGHAPRYRLSSTEEADEDGKETRFICQFFSRDPIERNGKRILGETLSIFPYNYEHANHQKTNSKPMLTRPKDKDDIHGAHNEQIWNSVFHFRCPVPKHLQSTVSTGSTVVGGIPSIYLDLVPIRTPARETREGYCPQVGSTFDFKKEWGSNHILPPVEESGRLSNIPVCQPPKVNSPSHDDAKKPHYIVGCLWASAAFTTRGATDIFDTSVTQRLLEWLVYHLFVAKLDHVYVYDNTEAYTNTTSLKSVLDLFGNRVSRIPWKHRVCNNNPPMHRNPGERSSQYTAEASCRLRYGPHTEWIAQLDTDEYLIPAGNWSDLQSWLKDSIAAGTIENNTHILTFFQTRAIPIFQFLQPFVDKSKGCDKSTSIEQAKCLSKQSNVTYLQAYDCERNPLPKPDFGWRAKKQIYRPSFVLNHFVHYSTVTRRIHDAPNEASPPFIQRRPYERRVNELTEGFMLHTKTTSPYATKQWRILCRKAGEEKQKKCPIGFPYTQDATGHVLDESQTTNNGFVRNCYQHSRIQHGMVPKLEKLLKKFKRLSSSQVV